MNNIWLASGIGLLMMGAAWAQETPPVAFNIGGGFNQTLGGTGQRLNKGGISTAASGSTLARMSD
jgi:hypothetical protein